MSDEGWLANCLCEQYEKNYKFLITEFGAKSFFVNDSNLLFWMHLLLNCNVREKKVQGKFFFSPWRSEFKSPFIHEFHCATLGPGTVSQPHMIVVKSTCAPLWNKGREEM